MENQKDGCHSKVTVLRNRPEQVEWRRVQTPYYELEDSRQAYLYDALISLGFVNRETSVLDFGCGDGSFLANWLAPKVKYACGYDLDAAGIERAKERTKQFGNVDVFSEIRLLPGEFDVVFLNAVWMTLATYDECLRTLITVRQHTKFGGILVAAVTHPCFRDVRTAARETTFEREAYLESGKAFQVTITGSNGKVVSFVDHHWTLTDMSRQLHATCWSNLEVFEIPDCQGGAPYSAPREYPPVWMVLSAEKQHGSAKQLSKRR